MGFDMGFLDKIGGWFGRAKDKIGDLIDRISGVVDRAAQIAEMAGEAALRVGDALQGLGPADLAWLFGPLTNAVIAAQESTLIRVSVGEDRLEAVRLALKAADSALHWTDRHFDARWNQVRPYIESLVVVGRERQQFGFKPLPDAEG